MEYNKCSNCGAGDSRAGNLFTSPSRGYESLCLNCRDTLESGQLTLHAYLRRTSEEIALTGKLLPPPKPIRPPELHAFFRGDKMTGKMKEAVRKYVEKLGG